MTRTAVRLNEAMLQRMRCPVCRTALSRDGDRLRCRGGGHLFPVVDDVPVLLNEENSLFTVEGVLKGASPPRIPPLHLRLRKRLIPSLSLNVRAERHFRDLAARLDRQARPLHVLVVGGGTKGAGIESLLGLRDVVVVDTDVKLGADRDVVCDAHDLPFQDGMFDAVIVQAVLEHVIDPSRCVAEIHRVLKDDGWVYAETPFIQQVHLQRYDYTRFTHLGHRRLFRHFVQVDSGAVCGPGMALAWTYRAFLFSLFDPRRNLSRVLLGMVADFTGFWLKYFDRYVIDIDNPNAINAASAVFFLGRKCGRAISDAELLEFFRGV